MKRISMNKYLILGFFFTLFLQVQAQEPNDCVNAITVCGNGTFSSNATGIGATQEVSGCGGFEHNSIWLEINVVQGGTLGFDLIPNDPDILVDYDFWVYGPNRVCGNLGSPIRCSTTNPNLAGLANNHTGMNGNTTLTQTGPGANGNGYVYWLNVSPGETYYIAIDRPNGEGGFDLNWTGTASDGTGAFPSPPTVNDIPDVKQCSSNPNISLFDLNALNSSINPDPGNNISYYLSLADATDEVNELPTFYANTENPQQVFAKVKSGTTDCYSIIDFNLVVTAIPTATVVADASPICEGDTASFTITGTPDAIVHYNIDSGASQNVTLDASGQATITEIAVADMTITLENVQNLDTSGVNVICSNLVTDSASIIVTPTVTPVFTQVAPVCSGEAIASLPTSSDNGVTGTWSPAIDNTATTTYTFTPDAGQCATVETMTIVVNIGIIPTFTQVAPICEGEVLSPLPVTSDNGVTGAWSPALNNTTTTTYTFTPDAGQCAAVETMTITVNPTVTPVFTQVAPVCSGEAIASLPTSSDNGVTGTWSPAINNTATTTYTFTPDAGQCATVETMTIVVNPTVNPTFTQVAPICEGEALAPLPTTSDNGVTGAWSPTIDNTTTTTYTFTPDAGQCATVETMTIVVSTGIVPVFAQVAAICEGEVLAPLPTLSDNGITGVWSPIVDNTTTTTYTFTPDAGQCAVVETMTIVVNPIVNPTFTQVAPICEGEALAVLPVTSDNGVTGVWSPAIDNTTATTYTFTPDAGQCATVETMTIVVNPTINPVFTQVAPICEGEALAALPVTSDNGVTGVWSPAIDNITTTTYTFTPDTGQCATVETMTIVVNSLPIIANDTVLECSVSGTGFYTFDLDSEIPNILGATQNPADFSVSFYEDAAETIAISSGSYSNATAYNDTIYINVTNNNSLCSVSVPFYLVVQDAATATAPNPIEVCDTDGVNDGIFEFDLTTLTATVLNGQNPAIYQVSYHTSSQGAENDTDLIQNPSEFTNTSSPYNMTVYIRVINMNIPDTCYATTSVSYTVSPILKPVISSLDGLNTLCVDFDTDALQNQLTLVSDIQGVNYDYTWYLDGTVIPGATQGSYVIDTVQPGLYTVSVTNTQSAANCDSDLSEPFEVVKSGQAVFVSVSQTGAFDPNPSITVEVEGYGYYWYQLDNGPILDNGGVFTNVSEGLHTVYVYDRKTENPSCGYITIEDIRIIDYPKVVTPNNDGFNDTWNITAFGNQALAQIDIFDRYGKILTSIKPSGRGWDGTYKGYMLPSSDYWFVLTYQEAGETKQFKSHFSLKR
ncbi:T9SS type B sorting domain-containing protein [Bizionia sp. KMM 8389]